jgi:hypothetical protein
VLSDHVVLVCQRPDEGLEPAFRAAMAAIEGGDRFLDAPHVGLEDGVDDGVFGLEVVVDVA